MTADVSGKLAHDGSLKKKLVHDGSFRKTWLAVSDVSGKTDSSWYRFPENWLEEEGFRKNWLVTAVS